MRHKFPAKTTAERGIETCERGCGTSRRPSGRVSWVYQLEGNPRWLGGTAPPCVPKDPAPAEGPPPAPSAPDDP